MRSTPDATQSKRVERLLAHEREHGDRADDSAAAAGRVYDKLHEQLAPLIGTAGFRALLARSAQLTKGELACLGEVATVESATTLRECLRRHAPAVARETAEALFGTFLALLTTFIGERLTAQVLRRAWPTLEGPVLGRERRR